MKTTLYNGIFNILKKKNILGWTRAQNPRTTSAGSRSTPDLTLERGRRFWRNLSRLYPYSRIMVHWGRPLVAYPQRGFK